VDVRVWRWIALRGEIRDFYAGSPSYNLPGLGGGQHNLVAGGGFVLRFRSSSRGVPNRYNWMSDTSPQAFAKLVELQQGMSAGEKIRLSLGLSGMLMRLTEAGIRRDHPKASEREIFLRAAARRLDREIRAYGWDPAGHDA
jgi:hypothetical protein